jgi:hypothetical protein
VDPARALWIEHYAEPVRARRPGVSIWSPLPLAMLQHLGRNGLPQPNQLSRAYASNRF